MRRVRPCLPSSPTKANSESSSTPSSYSGSPTPIDPATYTHSSVSPTRWIALPGFGCGSVTESMHTPDQTFQTDSLEFGSETFPSMPHATFFRGGHCDESCTSTKRSASGHANAKISLFSNRTKSDSARNSSSRISTYSPSWSETFLGSGKNSTNCGHENAHEKNAKLNAGI